MLKPCAIAAPVSEAEVKKGEYLAVKMRVAGGFKFYCVLSAVLESGQAGNVMLQRWHKNATGIFDHFDLHVITSLLILLLRVTVAQ